MKHRCLPPPLTELSNRFQAFDFKTQLVPLHLGLLIRPGPFAPPLALIPGLNIPILLSLVASQNNGAIKLTRDDKRNLALLRSILELVSPDLARRLGGAVYTLNSVVDP